MAAATTGAPGDHRHRRVILALILAVLIVALVLGALVAITHGVITVPGFGMPPTITR